MSEWVVRGAELGDVAAVAAAVEALLLELGGRPPSRAAIEDEVRALIEDEAAGDVLVAEAGGELIGVLGSSWQRAIHVPGRYVVVQDLWTDPAWRGSGVGAALIESLAEIAAEQGATRLEVGLPREDFAAIEQTTAFYSANGFEHLGPRMRRKLE
ncbi:MAG: branched-chain amino acid aminotransferase [Solirubrobacterales bacterium]|jgi:GNAT superfamily N-acetyltransferase|nr:branched-chain amino acid aminotransferase [Solirubrobacterales bacterium]